MDVQNNTEEVSNKIFTIPNLLSFIRGLMIPVFFVLLIVGNNYSLNGEEALGQKLNLIATIIFAVAASTDFLDGLIARKTHSVSKLGQILDPVVDRLLMISGALGVIITGRIPLWLVIIILLRDGFMLCGGYYLIKKWKIRVPVIIAGKVSTACLFLGFAGLLLNAPLIPGLGLVSVSWLPFFSADLFCWGILFVYLGVIIGIFTTTYYITRSIQLYKIAKKA